MSAATKKRRRKTPSERMQDTIRAQVREIERLQKKNRELQHKYGKLKKGKPVIDPARAELAWQALGSEGRIDLVKRLRRERDLTLQEAVVAAKAALLNQK